jgi:hypothetical protein
MRWRRKNYHWPRSHLEQFNVGWIIACQVRPGDVLLGRESMGRQNRGLVSTVSSSRPNDGTGRTQIFVGFFGRRIGEGFHSARELVPVRLPRQVVSQNTVTYGWGDSPPKGDVNSPGRRSRWLIG